MPSQKEENLNLFNFQRVNLPDSLVGLLTRKQSNKDSAKRGSILTRTQRILSGSALKT